jgi:hypothetical protein
MDKNMSFNKVIVWGFKIGTHEGGRTHTHGYVHHSFVKAFKHLGYDTLWLDDTSDISNINFDNALFLTEGQVCNNIPINKTAKYILHNCYDPKFSELPPENITTLQYFHKDVLSYNLERINDYTFYGARTVYQPWATDLLPHEINLHEARNEIYNNNNNCVWVGTYNLDDHTEYQNHTELKPFFDKCKENNLPVVIHNPWVNPISAEENRKLVNSAFLAPSINGPFQKKIYYIPCRLFKAISYGHLGITNNYYANKIFDNKLIYDDNPVKLFDKCMEKKYQPTVIKYIRELMVEVKKNHTYINRVNVLLDTFK